jgi:ABC-type multidrug transport system fused ATPase/permease subunit
MKHIPFVNSRGGKTIPDGEVKGEIEVRNLSFAYPTKKDVQVAKNVSFKVE